jgi:hypothetical protein
MTSGDSLLIVRTALATMGETASDLGPMPLRRELAEAAAKRKLLLGDEQLRTVLGEMVGNDPNGDARNLFTRYLHRWDHLDGGWARVTQPNTSERRQHIYDSLDADIEFRARCDALIPPRTDIQEPAIIAAEHSEWYSTERKAAHEFYWLAYKNYLRDVSRWPEQSIIYLDTSTDLVVERLSDPEQTAVFQTKGLVVGYVQSGKTANFTAVIAKAADAGYRLIIVLAGTFNILREQTQRRIDKELVGKELLRAGGGSDYADDADWDTFLLHGGRPSDLGAFDWQRLTGAKDDYQSLKRGIDALEFTKQVLGRRLNDPANLHPSTARLVVVKKNPTILKKFAKDLGAIRARLDEVPALIIDDESDQASINTTKPTAGEERRRTATNQAIVGLLRTLKRAQYIGYTATPFANVFINPDDAEDLFPKDYILPLDRPWEYMGVVDFFDLGPMKPTDYQSNEAAFVRGVEGEDTHQANLLRAIDSFVLAGAIKLFRENKSGLRYKHHTMLVHRSHQMKEHTTDAELVAQTFRNAGYYAGAGLPRLRKLFEQDFAPVMEARAKDDPVPTGFGELQEYVGACLARIEPDPVGIVNGDLASRNRAPNFDRGSVWRILVGGTKLSRGYTVEGLTISYYRRRARQSDTLMQMGRWFGFRRGYRDLVRLFIGRAEPDGQSTLDLYEAFRSICSDEEAFRQDLRKYSKQRHPRLLPSQVPPLVPSHLLPPTAKNKMYNAILIAKNLGGENIERTQVPTDTDEMSENEVLMRTMLSDRKLRTVKLAAERGNSSWRFSAVVSLIEHDPMLTFLRGFKWADAAPFEPVLGFLEGTLGDPKIADWLFLAPEVARDSNLGTWTVATSAFNVVLRSRDGERIKAFSEPRHRELAKCLVRLAEADSMNDGARSLMSDTRAVFLFYPCRDRENLRAPITMGFSLVLPKNDLSKELAFSVRDPNKPDAVVVNRV